MIFYLIISVLSSVLLWILFQGAPALPTKKAAIETMLALLDTKPGQKAVDFGSGDGRIVMALARAGIEAHGYEINPLLMWWSRHKIRKAGLENLAYIHWQSFWNVLLDSYDIVIIFGASYIMQRLKNKLRRELKPGAKVISNAFAFPNWPYAKKGNGVFLYTKDNSLTSHG